VLALPLLAIGLPPLAGLAPAAPLLATIGLGPATPVLGAFAANPVVRAVVGASAWTWTFAAAIGTGAWTTAGIADRAPSGWAGDPATAVDWVLGGLVAPEALLGALTFALAAVALGWVLSARHAPIALLGAMLWAAAVDAALGALGDGALGGQSAVLVAAAAAAVAIEFGLLGAPEREARPVRAQARQEAAI
jgi:hypothetical protein